MEKIIQFIIFSIILLVIVIFIYNVTNRRTNICNIYDNFKQEQDNITDKIYPIKLKDIFIKSAYNCCCIGGIKNDYVDLCALKMCLKNNARCLDFQIFSLNDEPIIAASTSKSFEYKEIYNYLSLGDTLREVNNLFCNKYLAKSDIASPLFLNFRINSNNPLIFNKIHKYILNTFNGSYNILLTDDRKELKDYTFDELRNKVIIMVDITESLENKNTFENSKLSDITNIKYGITHISNRPSFTMIDANSKDISCIYPNIYPNSKNYDTINEGFNKKYNFIFVNFQHSDEYLKVYKKVFNSSSFKDMNTYKF